MKHYLEEEEFNRIVDTVQDAVEHDDSIVAESYDDENLNRIAYHIINAVLEQGYSTLAITYMLMRYQMRVGCEMAEQAKAAALLQMMQAMGANVRIIPVENPFEP